MKPSDVMRIRHGERIPLSALEALDYDAFSVALLDEVATDGRVAAYFARAVASGVEIFAVLAHDFKGELSVLRTRVGERFASLTPQCAQLHLFEREIAEQHGVIPEGHPWFKPVRFHRPWNGGSDPWGRPTGQHPVVGEMEYYRIEGEEVHEVAVGPVHAGVIEPGHFRFQCHGEKVMHLEISLGYQHRAIEQGLAGGPHPATPYQMETIAGDTTIGHMSAHCQLLESLSGVAISPRATALRTVTMELERLANHVGDIGALATDVGFLPTASFGGRLRGDYLNLTAEICGSRFGRGMVRGGGVGFDISEEQTPRILSRLRMLEGETRGAVDLFFNSPSVLARLEGTGVVSTEDAEALGLVGVAARACGLVRDVRLHHSLDSGEGQFDTVIFDPGGDVFARASVRRREIRASLDLIRRTLKRFPRGEIRTPLRPLATDTLCVSLIEGWRGEIVHAAITNETGRFSCYKIVDPSFHNWSGLAMALRGEQISDFPLCNKSFNLSYCGFDL